MSTGIVNHIDGDRFWNFIMPVPWSGCWLWVGSVDKKGYGRFRFQGKTIFATHASLKIHGTNIPTGLCVLHKCDMPGCVRPEHLFVGTQSENMRDKKNKGRAHRLCGELGSSTKLTLTQVSHIRASDKSERNLAKEYGVSHTTIGDVRRNLTWRKL